MGLFSTSGSTVAFPWKMLTSLEQLDTILNTPSDQLKVIFKHSTRCSISSMALKGFEKEWNTEGPAFDLYFLDLIAHRDISNAIADKTHVEHQSPQIIVLDDSEAVYNASHHHIDATAVQKLDKK